MILGVWFVYHLVADAECSTGLEMSWRAEAVRCGWCLSVRCSQRWSYLVDVFELS